jgi:tRNA nucleotidyltransferase (CCA-adding enzyme)
MPDYMYLLESRLTPEQRAVMERVQELARAQDVNVYLTGGAVRDLISGMPIRDLDFTVEGNPVKMVRELEKGGASVVWEKREAPPPRSYFRRRRGRLRFLRRARTTTNGRA